MALIKCVECGEHFSSKAKACPTCGCPVEVTIRSIRKKQEIQKNQIIEKYNILGYSFSIDIKTDRYIKIVMGIRSQKEGILNDGRKMYYDLGNIDNVIDKFPDQLAEILDLFLDSSIDILTSYGCYDYDKNRFFEKYSESLDTTTILQPIYENYLKIMECQEELNQYYEELRQARRSTWTGGGFGIKGALKGHIKAQMMNAGNSALHSIPDSINHSKDMAEIAKAKGRLFRDENTINAILDSLEKIFDNTYDAVIRELEDAGKIKILPTNTSKASSIINNVIKKYNEDSIEDPELTEQCANAFFEDPMLYGTINTILYLDLDKNGEVERYAKNYGFYDIYLEELQEKLRDTYKKEISQLQDLLGFAISDNESFIKIYDSCVDLAKQGVDVNYYLQEGIEDRFLLPVSEKDKDEIIALNSKYSYLFNDKTNNLLSSYLNELKVDNSDLHRVADIVKRVCFCSLDKRIEDFLYGDHTEIKQIERYYDISIFAKIPQNATIFILYKKVYSGEKTSEVIALTDKGFFSYFDDFDYYGTTVLSWKQFSSNVLSNDENCITIGDKELPFYDEKFFSLLQSIQKELNIYFSNHSNGIYHNDEVDLELAKKEVEIINGIYNSDYDSIDSFRILLSKNIRTKTGKELMHEKELMLKNEYVDAGKDSDKTTIGKTVVLSIISLIATIIWLSYFGDLKWYWNLIAGWIILAFWVDIFKEKIPALIKKSKLQEEGDKFREKFHKYFVVKDSHIVLK